MDAQASFASMDTHFIDRLVTAGVSIGTVFDIGASNGIWSDSVAAVIPTSRFELFEPFDSPQYEERLAAVRAAHPAFTMHRVALGAENTTLRLNIYENHSGNSLIDSSWEGVKEKRDVPVRRLDDYVVEAALPRPDLVKMDIQGFELNVLKGGEKTCRAAKVLMLETWLYRGYGPETPILSEIIEWLEPRGFRLVCTGDAYVAPDLKLTAIDAYFLRADIADDCARKQVKLLPS